VKYRHYKFLYDVPRGANEELDERTRLRRQGLNWETLLERVANHYKVVRRQLKGWEEGARIGKSPVCGLLFGSEKV
jgi:hypothetical protein